MDSNSSPIRFLAAISTYSLGAREVFKQNSSSARETQPGKIDENLE